MVGNNSNYFIYIIIHIHIHIIIHLYITVNAICAINIIQIEQLIVKLKIFEYILYIPKDVKSKIKSVNMFLLPISQLYRYLLIIFIILS